MSDSSLTYGFDENCRVYNYYSNDQFHRRFQVLEVWQSSGGMFYVSLLSRRSRRRHQFSCSKDVAMQYLHRGQEQEAYKQQLLNRRKKEGGDCPDQFGFSDRDYNIMAVAMVFIILVAIVLYLA